MNFTLKTLTAVALLATLVVGNAHATNLWYDFEGDTTAATDKLIGDGSQDGTFLNNVTIQNTAPWGAQSALFGQAVSDFNKIETDVSGTELGGAFTMSAVINLAGDGQMAGNHTRLFGTHSGSGGTGGRLLFDILPRTGWLRIVLPTTVETKTLTIEENAHIKSLLHGDDHTITATYNGSTLALYADGVPVGSTTTSGTVNLGIHKLVFGEDLGGTVNENFWGTVDDMLILDRALSAADVATLHGSGAAAIVPEPGIFAMLAAGLMMLLIVRRKR